MICSKCGKELADGVRFCTGCGSKIEVPEVKISVQPEVKPVITPVAPTVNNKLHENAVIAPNASGNNVFFDENEKEIARFGDGFDTDILFVKPNAANMLLSDRRLYFKGSIVESSAIKKSRHIEEKSLDLKDVLATGFEYPSPKLTQMIIGIIIVIAMIITCIVCAYEWQGGDFYWYFPFYAVGGIGIFMIINAFTGRKLCYFVEYAGGKIEIKTDAFKLNTLKEFNKELRKQKDSANAAC